MKDMIQKIENIQKYCNLIKQNGTRYRTDVFLAVPSLQVLGELAEHYKKEIWCDEEDNLFSIEDDNCKIYINLKNK